MEQEQTKARSEPDTIGGEIRVGSGGGPPLLKWFNYLMFLAAAIYLLSNPVADGYAISVVFAAITLGWLIYIFVGNKPAEP